jgi:hypothetical protein
VRVVNGIGVVDQATVPVLVVGAIALAALVLANLVAARRHVPPGAPAPPPSCARANGSSAPHVSRGSSGRRLVVALRTRRRPHQVREDRNQPLVDSWPGCTWRSLRHVHGFAAPPIHRTDPVRW